MGREDNTLTAEYLEWFHGILQDKDDRSSINCGKYMDNSDVQIKIVNCVHVQRYFCHKYKEREFLPSPSTKEVL